MQILTGRQTNGTRYSVQVKVAVYSTGKTNPFTQFSLFATDHKVKSTMRVSFRRFSQFCFILTTLLALTTCPHSKVEESFALQATHDLFYHGVTPAIRFAVSSSSSSFWNASVLIMNQTSAKIPSMTLKDLPYDHVQYPGGKNIYSCCFCLFPFSFLRRNSHGSLL